MNPSIRLEVVKNRITNMEPGERLLLYYGPGQKTNLISRLSNLSHQIKIHSPKEQHPKNSAAITCTHCQQTVWQSHAINRRINTCDCLTAIFSPPYVELSSKEWTQCTQWSSQSALQDRPTQILRIRDHHDYAEDQADESPVGLDPNHPPINQNQINTQLCRCAFCELPDQEAAVTYPWYRTASQFPAPLTLPETSRKPICVYNLCDFCYTALANSDELLSSRIIDKIHRNLLKRYPILQSNFFLPALTPSLTRLPIEPHSDFSSFKMNSEFKQRFTRKRSSHVPVNNYRWRKRNSR